MILNADWIEIIDIICGVFEIVDFYEAINLEMNLSRSWSNNFS